MSDIPFHILIPARYASTRLPGKPLMEISGKPMIQHVWERAMASGAERVVVATDDQRIAEVVHDFGGEVCITDTSHASGTDRIAEAAQQLRLAEDDIVVNLQGDEPQVPPGLMKQVASLLARHAQAAVASLYERLYDARALYDPAVVKVVCDEAGYALYFSRAPLPWVASSPGVESSPEIPPSPDLAPSPRVNKNNGKNNNQNAAHVHRRHLGIYAYRVAYLRFFTSLPQSVLERTEKLEQLRTLSNGDRIILEEASEASHAGIDTESQLTSLRHQLQASP